MKKNIKNIPSIFSISSIRNIIISRISAIRHFKKFITLWWKYKLDKDFPIFFQIQTINRCNANVQCVLIFQQLQMEHFKQ